MASSVLAGEHPPRLIDRGGDAWFPAVVLPALTSTVLSALDGRLWHWYLIPVTLCGMLLANDVVDWAAGRLDAFDPRALVGLFGLHFFYLAPILHVMLDYWPAYIEPLDDWRAGLGAMATLNVIGLCVYRFTLGLPPRTAPRRAVLWLLNVRWFAHLGVLAFVVSLVGFLALIAHFGGLTGYLAAAADDRDAFDGYGWLLLIGESFPLVGFVVAVIRFRNTLASRPMSLTATFAVFAIVQFIVGGLRGSRSNTIWPLLIGLIVVHLAVRPVSRRTLAAMAAVFLAFMYGYGVYKSTGSEILSTAEGGSSVTALGDETGRTVPAMLLGDLGRSDVQAVVLNHQQAGYAPLAHGITYVSAAAFAIPDRVRPAWMRDKVEVGTDMLGGQGSYAAGDRSSRIYGLAGEAVLNFGPAGAVASFAVLGFIVRAARRRYARALTESDPGAAVLCGITGVCVILAVGSDLGNIAWFLVKTALPLTTVVVLAGATRRQTTRPVRPV